MAPAILVILALMAAWVLGFRGAGRWLVRQDALAPADAIFVLSGGLPYRAEEAAKIFRAGYAKEIWLSRPYAPVEELTRLGVSFTGEEEYSREVLIRQGVPDSAIHILPDTIVDTEQEIEEASREMRRGGKSSVIIVTSPQHTRRVRALWRLLVGKQERAIVRAATEDPFDAGYWWRNTRDALSVVREYLGLLNAWAGLPVRPHGT
ncbi:MAG: YdcF family protein [Candidatus Acidiferrales bacterium]